MGGWQPEYLNSQINSVTNEFTTTFHRTAARIFVAINGRVLNSDEFTEINSLTFQTGYTPQVGDDLFVFYFTDEIADGRSQGFSYDPETPPIPLPTGLEELLESYDQRLDALESAPGGGGGSLPPFSGIDAFVLTEQQPAGAAAWERVDSQNVRAAPQIVADLTERDALDAGIRREGQLAYVISDSKWYQLLGGVANSNWQEAEFAGGVGEIHVDVFVASDGATLFPLSLIPTNPLAVLLKINEIPYSSGTGAFTLVAGNIIWSNLFAIESGDTVEAHYPV